jgi:integrase
MVEGTVITDRVLVSLLKGPRDRRLIKAAGAPKLYLRADARALNWEFRYRLGGLVDGKRQPRNVIRLGNTGTLTIRQAEDEAKRLDALLRAGKDPKDELAREEATQALAAQRERTTDFFLTEYLDDLPKSKHGSTEGGALRLAVQEMGVRGIAPTAITTEDVLRLLKLHKGRPAAVHRQGALSRFLDHLVALGIVERNVVKSVPKRSRAKPTAPRERVLSADEMKRLWLAAEDFGPTRRDYLRAMILAPLRRERMAELRAGDVSLRDNLITLPGVVMKKRPVKLEMPIGPALSAILKPRLAGLSPEDRVFPLARDKDKPLLAWTKWLTVWRTKAGVADMGLHDLRRTFRSEAWEHDAGGSDDLEALLHHGPKGVAAHYDFAKRRPQLRRAMVAWERTVLAAIEHGEWPRSREADNVVSLDR